MTARRWAFVPDLMDRSKVSAATPDVEFVRSAAALTDLANEVEDGDVVLVDLSRPTVLDAIAGLVAAGARVVGFGSHVNVDVLAAARASGAEALPRSRFFTPRGLATWPEPRSRSAPP